MDCPGVYLACSGRDYQSRKQRFRLIEPLPDTVRIPSHGEHDSEAMANTVPRSWRTGFRGDGERGSEVMASSVPTGCRTEIEVVGTVFAMMAESIG
jgi:hypothetical protein